MGFRVLSQIFRDRFQKLKKKWTKPATSITFNDSWWFNKTKKFEQEKIKIEDEIKPIFNRPHNKPQEWWFDLEPQVFRQSYLDVLFKHQYEDKISAGLEYYGFPEGFRYAGEWLRAVYYWNFGELKEF